MLISTCPFPSYFVLLNTFFVKKMLYEPVSVVFVVVLIVLIIVLVSFSDAKLQILYLSTKFFGKKLQKNIIFPDFDLNMFPFSAKNNERDAINVPFSLLLFSLLSIRNVIYRVYLHHTFLSHSNRLLHRLSLCVLPLFRCHIP